LLLPATRHQVGVAGNVLQSVTASVRCLCGVRLQILNSFNISGTLLKFGKWVEYGRIHRRGEKFPLNGAWSGLRDPFKDFKPPIFLEWMQLRCLNLASKWIDYGKFYPKGKKIPPEKGVVWVT